MNTQHFWGPLLALFLLCGCAKNNPQHLPRTAANYQVEISVKPGPEASPAAALAAARQLAEERFSQLDITFQSIEEQPATGLLLLNLVDLPSAWGVGREAITNLETKLFARAKLQFVPTYRISDPDVAAAFRTPFADSLAQNGLTINDGNQPLSPAVLATTTSADPLGFVGPLGRPELRNLLPPDLRPVWSHHKMEQPGQPGQYLLYGLRWPREPGSLLSEQQLERCEATVNPHTGEAVIHLFFDAAGTRRWAEVTTQAYQAGQREIAILLNDRVVMAPRVQSAILSGEVMVSGDFTAAETQALCAQLELARFPHEIELVRAKQL